MPTIPQLPSATVTGAQDEIPISQGGITKNVSVAELLSGTQQAIEISSPSILGRASLGPGGPEQLSVGLGLSVANAAVSANGGDHASFVLENAFLPGDQVIVNSGGTPTRLPITALRGLFAAGANISIDTLGNISSATAPSVTGSLATLGASIATLGSEIPANGYAQVNSSGQVTSAVVGDVSNATIIDEAGATARSLASRALDVINVLDFGAIRGGADCTSAFNAAFSALSSNGGEIYIPSGDYWLQTPLVFAGKPIAVKGDGKGQTRIHFQHTGIGFDFAPGNLLSKVLLGGFSAYAESLTGQTAAVARITYPTTIALGYVSAVICDIECFGYPNSANGIAPFPQTFLRGFVLNYCWSTQVNNISWFGPPAAAGATSSAVIELNHAIDTRIHAVQAYYGNTVVLQTGYCEGIYLSSPLVVGVDYLMLQSNETAWPGYAPNKPMLLGLWVTNGELNTNLGTVVLNNVTLGFFSALDITRNGGPTTPQTFFKLTNVSNIHVTGCNFVGGPSGGPSEDIAFSFSSTWDSSDNIVDSCHFEDLATIISISGSNGTVGLVSYGLQIGNVPLATAFVDPSSLLSGNYLSFIAPSQGNVAAGWANTKDHVFTNAMGNVLFQVNNLTNTANFIRHLPATSSNPPTLCFDGSDGTVNGVIQTKGGNLFVNAVGGASNSGNLLSLMNIPGSTNWVVIQNATAGNLSIIETNSGGLSIQPKGALWLSPTNGMFMPGLPTVKPASGSNQIWNNGGVLSIA